MPIHWRTLAACILLFLLLEPANGMLGELPPRIEDKQHPNVVLILCDDLGIGDVQCFNPDSGKIKTPFIDQLAKVPRAFG